jgi:hypothetical protein
MKNAQQDQIILMMGASPQTLPNQPVMSIEQTAFSGELISLCGRPDALVLLPACANFMLPSQQTRIDRESRNTTIYQPNESTSGQDHE